MFSGPGGIGNGSSWIDRVFNDRDADGEIRCFPYLQHDKG
jgi:hypothetical protein